MTTISTSSLFETLYGEDAVIPPAHSTTFAYALGDRVRFRGYVAQANDVIPLGTAFVWGETGATWSYVSTSHFYGPFTTGVAVAIGETMADSATGDIYEAVIGQVTTLGNHPVTGILRNQWKRVIPPFGPMKSKMVGSDGVFAGQEGDVPAPTINDQYNILRGDGKWVDPASEIPIKNVVIVGSTMSAALVDSVADRTAFETLLTSTLGHSVSVYDCAVSGLNTNALMAQMDTLLGLIPNDIDNKTTVAVIHVGAEDVIANKPYTSAQDATIIASLISNTNTIISKVEARGWRVMLSDIAFANYGGGVITSEASGALPYTQKVQQAILDNRRNRYRHPDGRSWMDFYYAVKNNYATWLDVDNISLTAAGKSGIRSYIANILACAQDGVFPIQNPSPQALSAASTSVTPSEILVKLGASSGSVAEKAAARAAIGADAYLRAYDSTQSYVLGDKAVFNNLVVTANGPIPAGTTFAWGGIGATWSPIVPPGSMMVWQGVYEPTSTYNYMEVVAPSANSPFLYVSMKYNAAGSTFVDVESWCVFIPSANPTILSQRMVGATMTIAGYAGLVPKPPAGSQDKYLSGEGVWKDIPTPNTAVSLAHFNPTITYDANIAVIAPNGLIAISNEIIPAGTPFKWSAGAERPLGWRLYMGGTYTFRGLYNSSAAYNAKDVVMTSDNNGIAYVARQPNTNAAITDRTNWYPWSQTIDEDVLRTLIEGNDFTGATATLDGSYGRVPKPIAGQQNYVLFGSGQWKQIATLQGSTAITAGVAGLVPAPAAGADNRYLRNDGNWSILPTYVGATFSSAGTIGFVPASAAGDQLKFFRGDGTWADVPVFNGATGSSNSINGLVPIATIADQLKFLRGDGTWQSVGGVSAGSSAGPVLGQQTVMSSSATINAGDPVFVNADGTVRASKYTAAGTGTMASSVTALGSTGIPTANNDYYYGKVWTGRLKTGRDTYGRPFRVYRNGVNASQVSIQIGTADASGNITWGAATAFPYSYTYIYDVQPVGFNRVVIAGGDAPYDTGTGAGSLWMGSFYVGATGTISYMGYLNDTLYKPFYGIHIQDATVGTQYQETANAWFFTAIHNSTYGIQLMARTIAASTGNISNVLANNPNTAQATRPNGGKTFGPNCIRIVRLSDYGFGVIWTNGSATLYHGFYWNGSSSITASASSTTLITGARAAMDAMAYWEAGTDSRVVLVTSEAATANALCLQSLIFHVNKTTGAYINNWSNIFTIDQLPTLGLDAVNQIQLFPIITGSSTKNVIGIITRKYDESAAQVYHGTVVADHGTSVVTFKDFVNITSTITFPTGYDGWCNYDAHTWGIFINGRYTYTYHVSSGQTYSATWVLGDSIVTDTTNRLGIALASPSAGKVDVATFGGIVTAYTGMTRGTLYYVDSTTGNWTTTPSGNAYARAINSTTRLMLHNYD